MDVQATSPISQTAALKTPCGDERDKPLPVVCGRICTRPESQCRRNIVDEPIAIAQLSKRFAADIDLDKEVHYLPD